MWTKTVGAGLVPARIGRQTDPSTFIDINIIDEHINIIDDIIKIIDEIIIALARDAGRDKPCPYCYALPDVQTITC